MSCEKCITCFFSQSWKDDEGKCILQGMTVYRISMACRGHLPSIPPFQKCMKCIKSRGDATNYRCIAKKHAIDEKEMENTRECQHFILRARYDREGHEYYKKLSEKLLEIIKRN